MQRRRASDQCHGPDRDARRRQLPPLREPTSPARSPARWRAASADCELNRTHDRLPRNPVSARHRAEKRGGPERRTEIVTLGSGARGAQRALGAFAAALRRRLRRQDVRRLAGGGGVLRGAARPAVRLSLARPARSFVRRAAARRCRRSTRCIGTGDGATATFQLAKTYGARLLRPISGRSPSRCRQRARRGRGVEAADGTAFTFDAPPAS